MKRLARYGMACILAAFFLLSFTGVRLLIHHCMSCDTTDYAFLGFASGRPGYLHEHSADATACSLPEHHKAAPVCCDSHGTDHTSDGSCEECCNSEIHYLKADIETHQVKHDIRIVPQVLDALPLAIIPPGEFPVIRSNETLARKNKPPPGFVGRGFVIYSHQLKIPFPFSA